jgi:Xaa-Pro aminopeptidase
VNYETRLQAFRKCLISENIDALLISSVPHIVYLTGYNGFSEVEREVFLLITATKQYLLTDGRYTEAVRRTIAHFDLREITAQKNAYDQLKNLATREELTKIGFEDTNITVQEFSELSKCFKVCIPTTMSTLRVIKDLEEVEAIKTACSLGDKAFEYILNCLKPDTTEHEIALKLEFFIKKNNATLSFDTIVAFGNNAAIPHHMTGNRKLQKNDLVLLDFGVKKNNYCSDMTRTLVIGKADKKTKDIYHTVLEANTKAIEEIQRLVRDQKLVNGKEIDALARSYIVKKGYPTIPHGLGHGTGIEVHESPRLSPKSTDNLVQGMVFSVEPGIYDPTWGGVRIEDLVYIGEKNIEVLTQAPKELIEL